MCMGAIILARIPRLVYACRDPKAGAAGSIYNLASDRRFNHNIEVTEGVFVIDDAQSTISAIHHLLSMVLLVLLVYPSCRV